MFRLIVLVLFSNVFLFSDTFEPSHYCVEPSKPIKPYSFDSQWQLDSYNDEVRNFNYDVETYKSCIDSFISDQEDAIANHQRGIQSAINSWNNFINYN